MESKSTLELVENIRRGDDVNASQAALYERVRANLHPRLQKRIFQGVRARIGSDDVVNETFRRMLGGLDLFQGTSEGRFFAWAWTIAMNYVRDQAKRKSAQCLPLSESGPQEIHGTGGRPGKERRLESELANRELLRKLLLQLGKADRELVTLRELEGLSFEEIAEKLDKPTASAAQKAYSRARRKLDQVAEQYRRDRGSSEVCCD